MNFEETSIPDVNEHVLNTHVNINSVEQPSTSIPEKMKFAPPKVSHYESNMEDEESLNINVNLSNKETNVNVGEGMQTIETSTIFTTNIKTNKITKV